MLPSGKRLDRATALFISLLAVGFLVATFDVRASGDSATTVLRGGVQELAEPIQGGIDFLVRPVVGFVDGVSNVAGLRDQNERLEAEVQRLEARLRETAALERRVAELEAISDLAPPEGLATVTARIYSGGTSTFDQVRFINKGSSDGVIAGQAVIDESGLVGRVDLVTGSSARVRLITDPLVSVGVRIQDTNQTGAVTGRGDDVLQLEHVRCHCTGDRGGRAHHRRQPVPARCRRWFRSRDQGGQRRLHAANHGRPAAAFSELDFVKIVVGWSPLDADPETGDPLIEPPPSIDSGADIR